MSATGEVVQFGAGDQLAHAADEKIIAAGLATFVEVGRALMRIRERRSYLLTHSTFGIYIRERWRFNPPYAYNLMAGAEVYEVLDGKVEVLPANARVAYELRNYIDTPDELVKVWKRALREYGDKPLGREVARLVRDGRPPSGRAPAPTSTVRPSGAFADYVAAIEEATVAVERAKEFQRQALANISPQAASDLAADVKRLRALVTDVQKAIVRKT